MQKQDLSKQTRFYRKIHKWLAVPMFLVMFLIGVKGIILGCKKQTTLLPKTQKGATEVSTEWLKIDSLVTVAKAYSRNTLKKADEIERKENRPKK